MTLWMERVWVLVTDTKDQSVKTVSETFLFFKILQNLYKYIPLKFKYKREVLNTFSNLYVAIVEILVDKKGYGQFTPV